jgi:hypothetical protein
MGERYENLRRTILNSEAQFLRFKCRYEYYIISTVWSSSNLSNQGMNPITDHYLQYLDLAVPITSTADYPRMLVYRSDAVQNVEKK